MHVHVILEFVGYCVLTFMFPTGKEEYPDAWKFIFDILRQYRDSNIHTLAFAQYPGNRACSGLSGVMSKLECLCECGTSATKRRLQTREVSFYFVFESLRHFLINCAWHTPFYTHAQLDGLAYA